MNLSELPTKDSGSKERFMQNTTVSREVLTKWNNLPKEEQKLKVYQLLADHERRLRTESTLRFITKK